MNDTEQLGEIKDRISELFGYETAKDDAMYYMKKKHINCLIKQAEKAERYENAIRECIERMKEGGAGTRSFVFETLKKALEGEE